MTFRHGLLLGTQVLISPWFDAIANKHCKYGVQIYASNSYETVEKELKSQKNAANAVEIKKIAMHSWNS